MQGIRVVGVSNRVMQLNQGSTEVAWSQGLKFSTREKEKEEILGGSISKVPVAEGCLASEWSV